jgi:hypothetical protein
MEINHIVPETKEGKLFEKMIMAGFEPLKNIIEYEKLHNQLTEQDISLIIHGIGQGLANWVVYLKKVDEERSNRGNSGGRY